MGYIGFNAVLIGYGLLFVAFLLGLIGIGIALANANGK